MAQLSVPSEPCEHWAARDISVKGFELCELVLAVTPIESHGWTAKGGYRAFLQAGSTVKEPLPRPAVGGKAPIFVRCKQCMAVFYPPGKEESNLDE